jgi:prepilin-type processing-associated H-X9-DG protein
MPTLRSAKEQAARVVCQNNLKTIANCLAIYAMKNDQSIIPDTGRWLSGGDSRKQAARGWDSFLALLAGDKKDSIKKKYIICPSDRKKRVKDERGTYAQYTDEGEALKRSYSLNSGLLNTGVGELGGDGSNRPAKIQNIHQPASVILAFDMHVAGDTDDAHKHLFGNVQGTNHFDYWSKPYVHTALLSGRQMCNKGEQDTHISGCNWAMTDGHVEWHKLREGEEFVTGQPYDGLIYPNNWIWTKNKSGL